MGKRFLALVTTVASCLLFAEITCAVAKNEFNVERLPIGNPKTKFSFCAVKLNQIFDTACNTRISLDQLAERLKKYRIVMVGEDHTNDEHHIVELEVIKSLVESGKKVCLALEMFTPTQQQALDDYIGGKYPKEEFWDKAGWFDSWGYNIRYYQRIFDYARAHKIRLYGVNIAKKYASMLGRGQFQKLPEEDRNKLPEIDTTDVEHRFLIQNFMEGLDATQPKMFRNLYQAQSLWDAAMGEGAIKAAEENPDAIIVILAGSGHVLYNLGIGKIIKKRSPLPVASVIPVDIPKKTEESIMMRVKKSIKEESKDNKNKDMQMSKSKMKPPKMIQKIVMPDTIPSKIVIRSLADFLWGVLDHEGKSKYPNFGFSVYEKSEKGFAIKRVIPESIAEKKDFKKNDIILSIDGQEFSSKNKLRKYLGTKNWDDMIRFEILRGEAKKRIEFKIRWEKKEN